MTPSEKLEAGLITDAQYLDIVTARAVGELNRRLAEFTAEESKAMAELDDGYAARRKDKIAALLAVKQQEGWPESVNWPA
jgi:hypothetical protein